MKKLLLAFLLIYLFSIELLSQSGSAYSRYGIGDMDFSYSGRRLGMGQFGVAVYDKDYISTLNPAAWSKLNRTRIEVGLNYNAVFLSSAQTDNFFGEMQFSGFALGFPVSQVYGIGAALGIVPYSNVSYKAVQDFRFIDQSDYIITYEGRGGLSKLFIGTSYTLPFDLNIGADLEYYFGNLNYISNINFLENNINDAEYKRTYGSRGLGTTVGLITPDLSALFDTASISSLRIGASLNFISDLRSDTSLISTSNTIVDTIAQSIVDMKIPIRLNIGLSFELNERYQIYADYMMQNWSDYTFNNIKSIFLQNAFRFSTGFEYRPEKSSSFWEQIMYRAGFSYEKTQYKINGTGINQIAFYGGFSLPVSAENTLDIGLQYAMRGTTDSNLLKENILRLGLGVSFGELWFLRPDR